MRESYSMKILLVAINAKYIHSNLAIYNLRAYAERYGKYQSGHEDEMFKETRTEIQLGEYTINQQVDDIISDIYRKKPDVLAVSCYIWNIQYVKEVIGEMRKLYPHMPIWVGGPEVSYCAEQMLKTCDGITGVMVGEGEETFSELVEYYTYRTTNLYDVKGIVYRKEDGTIIENPARPVLDLTKVPFVYNEIHEFVNKIIYYESSRGCPFSCSYCLSSIDKRLRFRDVELVKQELGKFLAHKVRQVKFVDRTFNCNHKHAMEIWKYIKEHDNGVTNFHFEIAADLISKEEIELIGTMRKGLIQLEIGVQSTYLETIHEIKRVMDFKQVSKVVGEIKKAGNIHQHLDLIAGLPYETLDVFRKSFDDVYALHPEQLQLGFLKVLKGSYMYSQKDKYGLVYHETPPYEVLYNEWLSYAEVLKLKGVEEMVEVYYNSGQFVNTMKVLEEAYDSAYDMYEDLSEYYEEKHLRDGKHTRVARYEIFYAFVKEKDRNRLGEYYDALMMDLYLRENAKSRPAFASTYEVDKQLVRRFFEKEERERKILLGYEGFDRRQMSKMTHVEVLGGKHILFDYKNRNPLTNDAMTYFIQ